MPPRIAPDNSQPSATVEIPLEKPLPDYDLENLEQPTPRDVDLILVSQGFRDLIDDARGVLLDLISNFSCEPDTSHHPEMDRTPMNLERTGRPPYELMQLTGAICPGDDEVYRPGLWIVLRDVCAPLKQPPPPQSIAHIAELIKEFVARLQLE